MPPAPIPYSLEYGLDHMEMHEDAVTKGERVILVDDLIATGGTAEGAVKLLRRMGAEVIAACFVIDLPDLGGAAKLEALTVPGSQPGHLPRALEGFGRGLLGGAGISHISERTRKRCSRPLSSENMPPRPGMTSIRCRYASRPRIVSR